MAKFFFFIILLMNTFSFSQDINKIIIDEDSEKPMLYGYTTRDALSDSAFAWWYDSGYENYEPDLDAVKEFKDKLEDVSVSLVMGTWCSDSRTEVPRFFKIMDAADFSNDKIEIINVDREKEVDGVENYDDMDIELVPTFIFYKDGEEIGRIVETPKESLEKDIAEIVSCE